MTKHNIAGGVGKTGVMKEEKTGTPSREFFFAGRHVTSVFQGLSLSLSVSLAPGDGKERTLGMRLQL